jgi:hypothetical protein
MQVRFRLWRGLLSRIHLSAVTRRGETLGVYVPTRGKRRKAAEISELKAAADRLAEALSDVDEGELVAEFKQMRRGGRRRLVR